MSWKITLGEGASALTIEADMLFDLNAEKAINALGEVEAVDWNIEIEGELIDPDPNVVGGNLFTYLKEVVDKFDAVKVTIDQGATNRRTLEPEAGFIGPHVMNFRSLRTEEEGTGESHWRYAFTITYKSKGFTQEGENELYELHTSLRVTKKNGKVIRKVWKARAKAASATSAVASVKTFKPSEKFILEELETFYKGSEAEAIWIWEAEENGIKSWKCVTRFTGGRIGFVPLPKAGVKKDAVLFLKQRGPLRIDVEGEIITMDPKTPPPPAHYTESATLFRVSELENTQVDAEIHDKLAGEYRITYHEVYFSVGPTERPSHSGNHHLIDVGRAPGDGGVAG